MRRKKTYPQKGGPDYHQLWRIVDGAVADAFAMHPDYLSLKGQSLRGGAQQSITKRVVGAIMGYTGQASVQGRSGLGQRLK